MDTICFYRNELQKPRKISILSNKYYTILDYLITCITKIGQELASTENTLYSPTVSIHCNQYKLSNRGSVLQYSFHADCRSNTEHKLLLSLPYCSLKNYFFFIHEKLKSPQSQEIASGTKLKSDSILIRLLQFGHSNTSHNALTARHTE